LKSIDTAIKICYYVTDNGNDNIILIWLTMKRFGAIPKYTLSPILRKFCQFKKEKREAFQRQIS